jgi:antitoxin VapB
MNLNIKNEKTHRLVRELARVTGENMTAAVDGAVQERLERVRRTKNGGLAEFCACRKSPIILLSE